MATDVHGPIDIVILEFPSEATGRETADVVLDLVDRGIVRLYDLLIVRKEADGRCTPVDLSWVDGDAAGWARLAGARSGLLGDDEVQRAAEVLDLGTTGAVILYENAWAVPFVNAARGEGGSMVATARLTAQQIMDALDAVDAAVAT